MDFDWRVGETIMRPFVRQPVLAQSRDDHLERFLEYLARFEKIYVVITQLERRDSAPHSNLEAPAAHLIEHADLLDKPKRIVEREQIDQRPQMNPPRARRDCSEEYTRRRRASERRAVMFRQMVAVDVGGVGGLKQTEALLVQLFEWNLAPFKIENSKFDFHDLPLPPMRSDCQIFKLMWELTNRGLYSIQN